MQTNLAKLHLAKSLFLKHARTCFLLLKIRLAHTNRAKSKSTFEHVLAHATSKMLSAKTCRNMLESIFAFCSIDVCHSFFNKRKDVLAIALLPKAALLDWSAPGLRSTFFFYYFVQVSSNLSDNGKHKILTSQSCLFLNCYNFLFIVSTCNCFSYFLSTLSAIVFA